MQEGFIYSTAVKQEIFECDKKIRESYKLECQHVS